MIIRVDMDFFWIKKSLLALFFVFLSCNLVLAADEEGVLTISPWPFYIVALGGAIWFAVWLSRSARSGTKIVDIPVARERVYDKEIENTIDQELASVVGSKEARLRVTQAITGAVSEKVNRKVSEAATELKTKYESVIAEKDREQEIVHLKYKSVVAEKNQTEAIVQSIAEGLVVVNSRGEVVMMNPAAEKLLGVSRGQKIGKPLKENLREEGVISLVNDVAGDNEKTVEFSSAQQETRKIIRSSSAVVANENGQTVGMVSVLTDVTKQRELEAIKSQFVSNVTHELRTPIVATQKALDVIIEKAAGPLTDDQARFLDIAKRNLGRLSNLINDILDFSKFEAGKMKLELVENEIGKVIEEVCESLGSWAKSKEIRLEKKIQENLPKVAIDAVRIIQVLNNLVGNALKFTPKSGCVTLSAKIQDSGAGIEVAVQDTGMGIAKEDLKRAFERFLQVGERRQSDISGTGLGLSIAKEIVELHGGKIWAESEAGQGAKFIFVLPIQTVSRG